MNGALVAYELDSDGIFTAGSSHNGGIIVAFADGSARFISDNVDAGDPSIPAPTFEQMSQTGFESPYGVWGALGTAKGSEVMSDLDSW